MNLIYYSLLAIATTLLAYLLYDFTKFYKKNQHDLSRYKEINEEFFWIITFVINSRDELGNELPSKMNTVEYKGDLNKEQVQHDLYNKLIKMFPHAYEISFKVEDGFINMPTKKKPMKKMIKLYLVKYQNYFYEKKHGDVVDKVNNKIKNSVK